MTAAPIIDNSGLDFADKEDKDLIKAQILLDQVGDILRHIEYVAVEDALDAVTDALLHVRDARDDLGDSIVDYESEKAKGETP